jgi:hypothetical protein
MAKGFTPSSIAIAEILSILGELIPEFTKELVDFCLVRCVRRNAELHSGEAVFALIGTSVWLSKHYASCEVLLRFMGKRLDDLFEDPQIAGDMIASLRDEAAKSVMNDIQIHKQLWESKSAEERKASVEQATVWASRHAGHRSRCPACESAALIHGSGRGEVTTELIEDMILQKQTMVPASFECVACGLKISGLSKLSACGLGDAFTATSASSAAHFFGLHTKEELDLARAEAIVEPQWEEDFNEY